MPLIDSIVQYNFRKNEIALWVAAKPITKLPANWNALGGNSGVMSTLSGRTLLFIAGVETQHNTTATITYSLASLDIDTAELSDKHPRVQKHCAAGYCDSLMAMEVAGDEA